MKLRLDYGSDGLDVSLPDLSGLEVCRRLRGEPSFAGRRIVMLTAAAQREDMKRGLAAGADDNANDLIVYENVAAVIETDGKHAQLAVGTLVQVDKVWRLIDLPTNLVDEKTAAASGGYFFNVLNTVNFANPIGTLPQAIPPPTPPQPCHGPTPRTSSTFHFT